MKRKINDTQKIPVLRPEIYSVDEYYKDDSIKKRSQASIDNHITLEKHKRIKNKIISFCLALIIIFLMISVGLYAIFSRLNYEPIENNITINTDNIINKVYNILLIGTDKEDNGNSRSDSMILITIDKNSNVLKMTSFMRDLWVDIPDHESGRLNSAYTIGGPGLLMDTLESNFDIQIDDYILIDFEMFKQLIDTLGGITVEITDKEAKFINRTTKITVKTGENHLYGNDALIYCRIRKLDSDFMRTQRQRKVMSAIITKVKNQSIIKTASAGIDILPLITTDISPLKMIMKSLSFINAVTYDIEQLRIPADSTYSNKTIKSQAVLVADFEKNKELIHTFIYN